MPADVSAVCVRRSLGEGGSLSSRHSEATADSEGGSLWQRLEPQDAAITTAVANRVGVNAVHLSSRLSPSSHSQLHGEKAALKSQFGKRSRDRLDPRRFELVGDTAIHLRFGGNNPGPHVDLVATQGVLGLRTSYFCRTFFVVPPSPSLRRTGPPPPTRPDSTRHSPSGR